MTMSRQKTIPNKNVLPHCYLTPENHLDRCILRYYWKSEKSKLSNFENNISRREAIIVPPYVAVGASKEQAVLLRRQASYCKLSLRQVIPQQDPKDKEALKQKLLPVTPRLVFERSEERWLYLYFCPDECLYVGQTGDYVLPRASAHLVSKSHSPSGEYVRSHQHEYQDCSINVIRPSDCETLIRKSFFLPGEDAEELMQKMEEEYQERKRTDSNCGLDRAERVLIAVFQPRYNSAGNPSQDRE